MKTEAEVKRIGLLALKMKGRPQAKECGKPLEESGKGNRFFSKECSSTNTFISAQ